MKNKIHLIAFLCLLSLAARSQSVIQQPTAVNESGAAPDASAILDLQAAGKGVLVPRMTTAARTAIASPATGLLVFDTDSGKLWFFNGTAWQAVNSTATLSDADNDTKVQVEESPDEDIIRFDVAGTEVGRMDSKTFHLAAPGGSLFIGSGAGQSDDGTDNSNTFIGVGAGSTNTTGNQNTASGASALYNNTTGSDNTAIGAKALLSNTEGFDNTAVGASSLHYNSNGYRNTASGFFALYSNLVGNNNTANGYGALYYNETGSENVAFGALALSNNLYGAFNTALGNEGLRQNYLGSYNTATGHMAAHLGYSNSQCTAIGALTDVATFFDSYANATALGYDANTAADNTARIGNTSVTSIGGQVAWTSFSDGRFKRQVREDVAGLDFITRLRPVTYHWDIHALNDFIPGTNDSLDWDSKYDIEKMRFSGFIAQEVEEAARQAGYDFSGVDKPQNEHSPYGLRYSEFVVPIVKAMQEQQAIIEQQQATIEKQAAEIERLKLLEAQLDKISAALRDAGISVEE